jgi:hypothetical protein
MVTFTRILYVDATSCVQHEQFIRLNPIVVNNACGDTLGAALISVVYLVAATGIFSRRAF